MQDYYRNPPRVSESHETREWQYPKDFESLHALIERLARDYCKKVGTQAWIAGVSLLSLNEIEQSMWLLIKAGFHDSRHHFHAINAQLLGRPAIEIAVRCLLLIHDTKHIRTWEASDWETMVLANHFNSTVFKDRAQPTTYADKSQANRAAYTLAMGLTHEHEQAAIRKFMGTASDADTLSLSDKLGTKTVFPSVTEICIGKKNKPALLGGSPNLPAAQVLCRYYKFLCHPTHGGKNSLMQRAAFRGIVSSGITPKELVEQELQQDTIWVAMALQLLIATITAHSPYTSKAVDSIEVAKSLHDAWRLLGSQSTLGQELWEYWFKPRFGVI